MEMKEAPDSKKTARGSCVFRSFVFAVLPTGLILLLFCAFVGYDMRRSVVPPPFILPEDLTTASLVLLSNPLLTRPSQSTTDTLTNTQAPIASRQTLTTSPFTATFPQLHPTSATRELLPTSSFPSQEKQQAARKINEAFRQLQMDFAALQWEEKKRQDPDVATRAEEEALKNVYVNYTLIAAHLQADFGPSAAQQFEKTFLGLLIAKRDWRLAARHCSLHQDWDGAIYCARQAGIWDERFLIIYCSGARLATKIHSLFHPGR